MPSSSFSPRVVLISGANKGIGFEAARLLSVRLPQAAILLGTRSVDNGSKAVQRMRTESHSGGHSFDNVTPLELDVTSQASVDRAAQHVRAHYGSLDVLMCNAGVSGGSGETPETVFAVNVDGVQAMIEAFLPIIPASGLITVVASEVGTWATHEAPPALQQTLTSPETVTWPLIQQLERDWLAASRGEAHEQPWPPTDEMATGAYSTSKALLIAYLRSFAVQHPQPKLVITCPGYCATDLNHNSGHRTAAQGGESVSWPLLSFEQAQSGLFYQDGKLHPFVTPVPQFALDGFKRMKEEQAARAKAQQGK